MFHERPRCSTRTFKLEQGESGGRAGTTRISETCLLVPPVSEHEPPRSSIHSGGGSWLMSSDRQTETQFYSPNLLESPSSCSLASPAAPSRLSRISPRCASVRRNGSKSDSLCQSASAGFKNKIGKTRAQGYIPVKEQLKEVTFLSASSSPPPSPSSFFCFCHLPLPRCAWRCSRGLRL